MVESKRTGSYSGSRTPEPKPSCVSFVFRLSALRRGIEKRELYEYHKGNRMLHIFFALFPEP